MTVFTELSDGEVVMKKDRPFLIVSSTSWTGKYQTYKGMLQDGGDGGV